MTTGGTGILGVDEYGIEEGLTADFVVYDAPSFQWVIMGSARRTAVVSSGQVVARGGRIASATYKAAGYEKRVL